MGIEKKCKKLHSDAPLTDITNGNDLSFIFICILCCIKIFSDCEHQFHPPSVVDPRTNTASPTTGSLPRKWTPIPPGKYVLKRPKVTGEGNQCYSSKENAQHCVSSKLTVHGKGN